MTTRSKTQTTANLLRVRDQVRVNRLRAAEHPIERLPLRRREPARSWRRRRNRSRVRADSEAAAENRGARCDQRPGHHCERTLRRACTRTMRRPFGNHVCHPTGGDPRKPRRPRVGHGVAASSSAVSSDLFRLRLTDATVTIQQSLSSRSTSTPYPSGVVPCQTLITVYTSPPRTSSQHPHRVCRSAPASTAAPPRRATSETSSSVRADARRPRASAREGSSTR